MKTYHIPSKYGETTFFMKKDPITGKIHFSMDGNSVELSVKDAKALSGLLIEVIKE